VERAVRLGREPEPAVLQRRRSANVNNEGDVRAFAELLRPRGKPPGMLERLVRQYQTWGAGNFMGGRLNQTSSPGNPASAANVGQYIRPT
jgi:hypothetical protein